MHFVKQLKAHGFTFLETLIAFSILMMIFAGSLRYFKASAEGLTVQKQKSVLGSVQRYITSFVDCDETLKGVTLPTGNNLLTIELKNREKRTLLQSFSDHGIEIQAKVSSVKDIFLYYKIDDGDYLPLVGGVPIACGVCSVNVNITRTRDRSIQGRIVVSHDVNTFGTERATEPEEQFAVNVARWLYGRRSGGKVLVMESLVGDPTRNFSPRIKSALERAGFSVTVRSNIYNYEAVDLGGFDLIFTGITYSSTKVFPFNDLSVLHDFVKDGGGVYLYGGVSDLAHRDAALINPFLAPYGIEFIPGFNWLTAVNIDSTHPIFACVKRLQSGNGTNLRLSSPPVQGAMSLQLAGGNTVYAAFDGDASLPE